MSGGKGKKGFRNNGMAVALSIAMREKRHRDVQVSSNEFGRAEQTQVLDEGTTSSAKKRSKVKIPRRCPYCRRHFRSTEMLDHIRQHREATTEPLTSAEIDYRNRGKPFSIDGSTDPVIPIGMITNNRLGELQQDLYGD